MKHAARLARLEAASVARDTLTAAYAAFGVPADVDPSTLTDPIQRAGERTIRALAGQPGGPARLTAYLAALAAFGRDGLNSAANDAC